MLTMCFPLVLLHLASLSRVDEFDRVEERGSHAPSGTQCTQQSFRRIPHAFSVRVRLLHGLFVRPLTGIFHRS